MPIITIDNQELQTIHQWILMKVIQSIVEESAREYQIPMNVMKKSKTGHR